MHSATRTDHSTREFLQSRVRLRPDLVVAPIRSAEETWYQVESPVTGRFFRIGRTEYTFLSLLDGETTLAEAISLTSRHLGPQAINERQAESLVTWLMANQLTEGAQTEAKSAGELVRRQDERRVREWLNPFWMKIPLARPDRWIKSCLPLFGWMHSVPVICLAILLWIVAASRIVIDWQRFCDSFQTVFHRSNWLWFGLVWIGLKCVHEFSHALVCRRYGGPAREMGVIFILLAPVAFVDVTSSLRFRSKWQRMHTSAAGMYAEITLAAFAALLWAHTDSTELAHLLVNVIWTASLTTLLFNANPLMKFDGYYLLADFLEIQNLASRGQESLRQFARRWLLGQQVRNPADIGAKSAIVFGYGVGSLVWRLLVSLGLLATASALWQGAGVMLAAAALLIWIGQPLVRGLAAIRELALMTPRALARASFFVAGVASILAAVLWLTPWPTARTAPGFVEYRDLASVRAKTPGFVRVIHVADGQLVEQGQVMIELENREIESEVRELEFLIQQAELRHQQQVQANKPGAAQVEVEQRLALEKRLAEKQSRLDNVVVVAPIAGRVMARDLGSRIGTYALEGDELLVVGQESEKEFRASLSQEDANVLERDADFRIRLHQLGNVAGNVRMVTPRASRVPPHPSLIMSGGGPLTVRLTTSEETSDGLKEEYELTEPRVTVAFALANNSELQALPSGTVGFVALQRHAYGSLSEGLWRSAETFVRDQFDAAWRDVDRSH